MDVTKHIFTLQYRWHRDPCMLLDMPLCYCSVVVQSILLTWPKAESYCLHLIPQDVFHHMQHFLMLEAGLLC